jgi:phosphatidylinositol alpha-mannosyltransferase
MAAGVPVVAARVGGVPALVSGEKPAGLLVPPHDINALADCIRMLFIDVKKARAMGMAGRSRAKLYDWDERANAYARVFDTIANRCRVVHALGYYSPHVGGMEQRTDELTTLLAARDINIRILTSNRGTPTGTFKVSANKTVHYLRSIELAHTPITPGLLWHLLTKRNIDIIHMHVAQAFYPEVVGLIAYLRGIPYIAHIRGLLIPSGVLGRLIPLYDRFLLAPVIRNAQHIIVLTPDYCDIVRERFGVLSGNISVIPNATTFSRARAPKKRVRKLLRIVAVGRISVQKNYGFMLDAVTSLKERDVEFQLTIVGSGMGFDELKAEVRKRGLESRVLFAGEVIGKSLEDMYAASDLFLHTSLFETFGTVFIEAMSKGLPIVATNVPGTRNVVKHGRNGLLAPFSAEEMSEAIARLSGDTQLYHEISRRNLEDVREYDWEHVVNKTIALYQSARKTRVHL